VPGSPFVACDGQDRLDQRLRNYADDPCRVVGQVID